MSSLVAQRPINVFPARAGMSRPHTTVPVVTVGFPRTRGDEPGAATVGLGPGGFSPHARG